MENNAATNQDTEIEKENRKKSLESYRDKTIDVLNKSYDHFEKQLSYISAGTLGLSFILIEKVLKDIKATSDKGYLICGWIALGLTLLVNLLSHKYAIECHYKTIHELNEALKGDGVFNKNKVQIRRRKIEWLNTVSMILLFAGIGLILFYTSINLLK